MKKFLIGLMTATIVLSSTIVSFAGEWKQTGYGWWYDIGNGSHTVNNWQNINNTWYYFNQDGYMRTGWIPVNGKWYYCHANGEMAHDVWIEGKYYVGADGAMYVNTTTPDGYKVDGSGCVLKKVEQKAINYAVILEGSFIKASGSEYESYQWCQKNGDRILNDSRIKSYGDNDFDRASLAATYYPESANIYWTETYIGDERFEITGESLFYGHHIEGGNIVWTGNNTATLVYDYDQPSKSLSVLDNNVIEINGEKYIKIN